MDYYQTSPWGNELSQTADVLSRTLMQAPMWRSQAAERMQRAYLAKAHAALANAQIGTEAQQAGMYQAQAQHAAEQTKQEQSNFNMGKLAGEGVMQMIGGTPYAELAPENQSALGYVMANVQHGRLSQDLPSVMALAKTKFPSDPRALAALKIPQTELGVTIPEGGLRQQFNAVTGQYDLQPGLIKLGAGESVGAAANVPKISVGLTAPGSPGNLASVIASGMTMATAIRNNQLATDAERKTADWFTSAGQAYLTGQPIPPIEPSPAPGGAPGVQRFIRNAKGEIVPVTSGVAPASAPAPTVVAPPKPGPLETGAAGLSHTAVLVNALAPDLTGKPTLPMLLEERRRKIATEPWGDFSQIDKAIAALQQTYNQTNALPSLMSAPEQLVNSDEAIAALPSGAWYIDMRDPEPRQRKQK